MLVCFCQILLLYAFPLRIVRYVSWEKEPNLQQRRTNKVDNVKQKIFHREIYLINFIDLPVELVAPLRDGTGIFKLLENVLDFFIVPEPSLSRNDVFVMARDLVSLDSVALLLILELLLHGTWFPATPLALV